MNCRGRHLSFTNLAEVQTRINVVKVPVETLIDQLVICVEEKVMLPFVAIIGLTSHFKDLDNKINMDKTTNIQHSIASPATINDQAWYIDSGVTNHITTNLNTLSQKTKYKGNEKLVVGNGQLLPISHIGKSLINSDADFKALFMNHE